MRFDDYFAIEGEKPLDNYKPDGGFTKIFRTIACIGDSLSSGELERRVGYGTKYDDIYEYSWGQFIARACGSTVYNFSKGGMTAKEYLDSFAADRDLFNPMKATQAYIMALGVNDLMGMNQPIGTIDDIDVSDPEKCNTETFAGCYGKVFLKYKQIQPKARFFLMSMPRYDCDGEETLNKRRAHADLLHDMAKKFDYTYVIDLFRDGPVYDKRCRSTLFLNGHQNVQGYMFTAEMVMTYIDYIIRNKPEDFLQVGYVGTPWHCEKNKW